MRDIFLSDIVKTKELSEETLQRFSEVKITNGPERGERRVLTNQALSRLLRKHLRRERASKSVDIKIPQKIIIENKAKRFSKEDLITDIQSYWDSNCKDCRYEFSQVRIPNLELKHGDRWKIQVLDPLPKGQFNYALEHIPTEGMTKKYWVQGFVRAYKKVPVATRALRFGERLSDQDFTLSERDITFSHDSAAEVKYLPGRRLQRSLQAGHPIWNGSLQKEYATRAGQPVKVVLTDSNWTLSVSGIAQSNGQIGDLISVRNPKSNKLLSATVVADGKVEIQ